AEEASRYDPGKRDESVMTVKHHNWLYNLIDKDCNKTMFFPWTTVPEQFSINRRNNVRQHENYSSGTVGNE
ncbi:hypothetical protein PFISCL1PPCAC_1691, partial [Pristionchus fissidentatus]